MRDFETLRVDEADGLTTVTVSRPEALNALSALVLTELRDSFTALADELPTLRGVILTGDGGRAFIAGADIREMSGLSPDEAARFGALGQAATLAIEQVGVPVIAAVDGFALGGGCEFALACDMIYATDAARFGQPEVKLGLIPGFGGTVRLPRLVGPGLARELVYTGRTIDAAEAERIGLVTRRFGTREQMMDAARATFDEITAASGAAIANAKSVIGETLALSTVDGLERERLGFEAAFRSDDAREGISAFLAKRPPNFTGR